MQYQQNWYRCLKLHFALLLLSLQVARHLAAAKQYSLPDGGGLSTLHDLVLVEKVVVLDLVALAEVLAAVVEMTALWIGTEPGDSESVPF